jgi:hypothetical protein
MILKAAQTSHFSPRTLLVTTFVLLTVILPACSPTRTHSVLPGAGLTTETHIGGAAPPASPGAMPTTTPFRSGGSDGGGGGLAFYRAHEALKLARELVAEIEPSDFGVSPLTEQKDKFESDLAAKCRAKYRELRPQLITLLDSMKVRVVDSDDRRANRFPTTGTELLISDSPDSLFARRTDTNRPANDAIDRMDRLVSTILTSVLDKQAGHNSPSSDLPCDFRIPDGLIDAAREKPIGHKAELKQYFQFTGGMSLSLAELVQLLKTKKQPQATFHDRLEQARKVAADLISTTLKRGNKTTDGKVQSLFRENGALYLDSVRAIKISEDLKIGRAGDEFDSKQARYHSGEVEFTYAARYARLDELTFILLHEVGHSLPIPLKNEALEQTINLLALSVIESGAAFDASIEQQFDADRRRSILSLQEIYNRPLNIGVRIYNWAGDGSRKLYTADEIDHLVRNEPLDTTEKLAASTCHFFGFPAGVNFENITKLARDVNDKGLYIYDTDGNLSPDKLRNGNLRNFEQLECFTKPSK